ncbi:MAG: rhodanese-like domain-containing protein [Desulfuromonadales bacterium]|nr:rhodanese-like domain-containing protein [Desulfuromonadales bacterium]
MRRQFMCCLLVMLALLPAYADAAVSGNLTAEEAFNLVGQSSDLFLLDVRTREESRQARLEGARLIPIDQFARRLAEVPKNRPILVYCAVGSRSAQVVNYLARQGYSEVYNLYGGIYSWQQNGYPVLGGKE